MNLTPFGRTQMWSTLIFEQHKPKAAPHTSRFIFLQWNLHCRGEHWWCFHRDKLYFFSRATACGCSLASPAGLWEPVGAGLTGKVSSPLALNVKLYAGNQLLICNEQSNPSALIQGLNESLLTGGAWKTWFIPQPVVACWSEADLASHPQQKSQTRAGLCCWKGRVWFYHLHNPRIKIL